MPRRAKKAKVYGIRPHVFHMWADDLMEAIKMQHERVLSHRLHQQTDPADLVGVLEGLHRRAQIDFDFYFVVIRRLLRLVESAVSEGYGSRELKGAIKLFKSRLPGIVDVRDGAEHADDWLRDGRTRSWGMGLGEGQAQFSHGVDTFNLSQSTQAARALFDTFKQTVPSGAPASIVPPLRPGEAARAIREATWHPGDPE